MGGGGLNVWLYQSIKSPRLYIEWYQTRYKSLAQKSTQDRGSDVRSCNVAIVFKRCAKNVHKTRYTFVYLSSRVDGVWSSPDSGLPLPFSTLWCPVPSLQMHFGFIPLLRILLNIKFFLGAAGVDVALVVLGVVADEAEEETLELELVVAADTDALVLDDAAVFFFVRS